MTVDLNRLRRCQLSLGLQPLAGVAQLLKPGVRSRGARGLRVQFRRPVNLIYMPYDQK